MLSREGFPQPLLRWMREAGVLKVPLLLVELSVVTRQCNLQRELEGRTETTWAVVTAEQGWPFLPSFGTPSWVNPTGNQFVIQ